MAAAPDGIKEGMMRKLPKFSFRIRRLVRQMVLLVSCALVACFVDQQYVIPAGLALGLISGLVAGYKVRFLGIGRKLMEKHGDKVAGGANSLRLIIASASWTLAMVLLCGFLAESYLLPAKWSVPRNFAICLVSAWIVILQLFVINMYLYAFRSAQGAEVK